MLTNSNCSSLISLVTRPTARNKSGVPLILSILLFALCILSDRALAERFKLISSTAGWALNNNSLYSTKDGGASWSDVTPIPKGIRRRAVTVDSTFLLDASQGWAFISYPEALSVPNAQPEKQAYKIARTVDGGGSWSFIPFMYPKLADWQEAALAGFYGIFFLDYEHGWLGAGFAGGAHTGKLLSTDDGGKTWRWINSPGPSGSFRFVTLQDGWLAGGPDYKLYATHDGAQTWQEVSLSTPPEVGAATDGYVQEPPVFGDSDHGYVGVQYVGPEPVPSKFVVYSTKDGGRTWSTVKVLDEADQYTAGSPIPFSIVNDTLYVAVDSTANGVKVTRVPLNGGLNSGVKISNALTLALKFADGSRGLAMGLNRNLFFTTDGGATWNDATPWRVIKPPVSAKPAEPQSKFDPEDLLSFSSTQAASTWRGTYKSIHLGMDSLTISPRGWNVAKTTQL